MEAIYHSRVSEYIPLLVNTKTHVAVFLFTVLSGAVAGQVTPDDSQENLIGFQIRQVVTCTKNSRKWSVRRDTSAKAYCLSEAVIVDESNVVEAHDRRSTWSWTTSGKVEVSFSLTFNRDGSRKLQAFSNRYRGKSVGILVDGELVEVSKIFEELRDAIRIQGDHFDSAEVAEWVDRFNKVRTKSTKPNQT
jgi:preprotein translocase subunit SecD